MRALGIACIATALVCAGVVVWRRTVSKPFDPRESAAGQLMGPELTRHMLRIASAEEPKLDVTRAQKALGQLPGDAYLEVFARASSIGETGSDPFLAATSKLNAALSKASLPYWVDSEVVTLGGRELPLVMSFYSERHASFRQQGKPEERPLDSMYLWRLDSLNAGFGYLGYTRARSPFALVMLDQVERELALFLLPALADNESFQIASEEARAKEQWPASCEAKLGLVLRQEQALKARDPELHRVAGLLAARRALIHKWRALFPQIGLKLRVPERFLPDIRLEGDLAKRIPHADIERWESIDADLRRDSSRAAFGRAREHFAASVERHELQHLIDYRSGLIPVPALLGELLGVKNLLDAPPGSIAGRARDELSAYLAEIAQGSEPTSDFVLAVRRVLEDHVDAYSFAGWALLIGVSETLGLNADVLRTRGRLPAREGFAHVVSEVVLQSPERIREAARTFRKQAFGDLATVALVSEQRNRAWPH
jgi:hypothetical protein